MPNPLSILPDAILITQQYLRLRPEITALTAAAKVVSELPATTDYSTPYVVVQWAGGIGHWPAIDEPAVQIDVIGGSKYLCGQVTRTVRAAIWAIANDTVSAGVLASGSEEVAPSWLPDTVPVPPLPRYTARYRIIIHP